MLTLMVTSTGNNLGLCLNLADQCCTSTYLTSVENEVRENMQIFLLEEFDYVIDEYLDDFKDLVDCKATFYMHNNSGTVCAVPEYYSTMRYACIHSSMVLLNA